MKLRIPGHRFRQLQHGITLVELLVAGLLLSIGLMGLVNVWAFSFTVTTRTDDMAVAYNLGRAALERVKRDGFPTAAEGSTTAYYNGLQQSVAQNQSRFTVTTSVTSEAVKSGTIGRAGAVPADTAKRIVVITVTATSDGAQLYTTTTYLVRAGI